MKISSGIIVLLFIILISGCYMAPSETSSTVSLNITGQELPPGYIDDVYRVSIFLDGSIDGLSPIDNNNAYIWDGFYVVSTPYTVIHSLPAIPINGQPYEDFPGSSPYDPPYSGRIEVNGIIPDIRYKILLETFNAGDGLNSTNLAGISDAFVVTAGQETTINIELQSFGFGDST